MKNQKTIMIIIGACIIIAGAAGIVLTKKDKSAPVADQQTAVVDTTETDTKGETLHACDVVSKDVIEAALGRSVQAAQTTGVTNVGETGETCGYNFEENGSIKNSFYVDIIQFKSQAEADEAQEYSGMNLDGVDLPSAFGSYAKYRVSESPYNGDMDYIMYLQNGTRVTKLVIAESKDKLTFTGESARDALDQIVKEAKLTF